jgi:DNA polymerase IV
MHHKVIFHLDMDQFFVAVELRDHPSLRGKPVAVGGSRHVGKGIITTASYEARRYGLHSGMAVRDALQLCPQVIFVHPDIAKYVHVSQSIFRMLLEYTDRVEPVSVDEAYFDVSDVVWKEGGVEALAMKIKRRIVQTERVTATIGAGANRQVAKVAAGMHKPDGFTYLSPERVADVYRDMPVGDLCGVGRATEQALHSFGVHTAGQLAVFPVEILKRRFGKWGAELSRVARGEGDDVVLRPDERPQEKSMGHEQTFSRELKNEHDILGRLHLLCEKVARRLRAAQLAGKVVSVTIRYKGFETVSHERKVKRNIQHEMDIYPVAEALFHEAYQPAQLVRLVGVHVADLMSTAHVRQLELFVPPLEPDDLTRACDDIKERFGERAIGFASGTFNMEGRFLSNARAVAQYNPFHHRIAS